MINRELPVLALVVPCYNEEEIINETCNKLLELLNKLICENSVSDKSYISFVDDGSTDDTYEKLQQLSSEDKKIKILKLICNFGHQKAILCGIVSNKADIYITLDADLQDDINVIYEMIKKYKNNDVEIVYGVRNNRDNDSLFKHWTAELYYKFYILMGGKGIFNCADFRLVSYKVAEVLKNISDYNLYLRGLIPDFGFKYEKVYFSRKKRTAGYTKYTLNKILELASVGIISCSARPIYFIFILFLLCFILAIIKTSSIYFVGSLILLSLYILGEYVTKTYFESKNRPNFIISDKINYD